MHIENKGVGQRLLLASGNSGLVLNRGQVAEDGGIGGGIGVEWLRPHELAAEEGNLNGLVFIVGDVNNSLSRAAIDQLDTEDIGLRESGDNLGVQLSFRGDIGSCLIVDDRRL